MNKQAILLFAAALGIVVPIRLAQAQETLVRLKDARWDIVINGQKTANGRIEFAEKLESGRCLQGCMLILKNGLQDYTEICGGRVTEAGRLDILEGGSLVTSLIDAGTADQQAATQPPPFS